ncbi:enoyl-[acyl-carrier-protein] reductase, mitochondrial-like isoform X2 [Anticarsia gemmatalis]|uniref:enoyl-[acyl-carrier-protein] reductase, mitochondrial-like isoform X2 n=1 Tax=Anticarsia gemmatalis TaxID=129554 RepID=UPI003F7672D4
MALAANTKQIAVAKNLVNLLCPVRGLTSKQLTFNEFGDPLKVVEITEKNVPCLRNRDVLVRMIAAPINPADMNTIQGKYPIKPELPAVPGNEGVGIVEEVGIAVKKVCVGDKVIIVQNAQGFWMTAWNKQADENAKANMFSEIICLMCSDMLRAPIHAFVKLDDYKEGLKNTLTSKGFSGCKYILDFCCD